MSDAITKLGRTVIQHGPHNDRIYVMKLADVDMPHIVQRLTELAVRNSYSKIFVKAPAHTLKTFARAGYLVEAHIPGFFNGRESVYFLAKYFSRARAIDGWEIGIAGDFRSLVGRVLDGRKVSTQIKGITLHVASGARDAAQLAGLYGKVFKTYPFPIDDARYILKTMEDNIRYFYARVNGSVASAASAEMDGEFKNVEMTDFATSPAYRGNGLSSGLLRMMEKNMAEEGMKIAYTIARASSVPINRLFSRAGYAYGGRLVNNTNICGSFESMNVWYKSLG